jgi:hypothetical protein
MSDEPQTNEQQASELEREERRLERLRLVVNSWPPPEHFDDDSPPQTAA